MCGLKPVPRCGSILMYLKLAIGEGPSLGWAVSGLATMGAVAVLSVLNSQQVLCWLPHPEHPLRPTLSLYSWETTKDLTIITV